MCGRYALTTPPSVLAALYRARIPVAVEFQFRGRYNIAPTQIVPAIIQCKDQPREVVPMRWGLIPSWAKDPSIGSRMINARSETAAEKPAFRKAFRARRCIIPASGFYEWKKPEKSAKSKTKQPYYIRRAGGEPLALAGLWETWHDKADDREVRTFTILTTEANEQVRSLHDRMPAILEPEEIDLWLDPAREDVDELCGLLKPAAEGVLEMHAVSTRVNKPAIDDAFLIEPLAEEAHEQRGLFER